MNPFKLLGLCVPVFNVIYSTVYMNLNYSRMGELLWGLFWSIIILFACALSDNDDVTCVSHDFQMNSALHPH